MPGRLPYNPTPYDDDWEDQLGQGPFYQWGLGVLLPLAMAAYSLHAMWMREAEFGGSVSTTLRGPNAVAFGAAWLSAALFIHCHYYWGNVYNQAWFAVLGKVVAACGFIAGLAFVIVRHGVLGIG